MTTIDGVSSARVPIGAAVPSLVRWGLSSDADLVFRTLATFGPRTERALAVDLGLSARRTAGAVAELRECGAARSTTDPRTTARIWTSLTPATVVQRLRARRLRPIDPAAKVRSHHEVMRTLRSSGLTAALGPGVLPALRGAAGDGMRYLDSRATTRRRLADLVAAPVADFWSMTVEQAIDAESAQAAAPMDRAMYERGTRIRLLRPPVADGDTLDVSGDLVDGRTYQLRVADEVPLRLIIIDRSVALLPADPDDLERGYLEIHHPEVLRSLVSLFDRRWRATATMEREVVAPIVLSDRETRLVALLAAGHTDRTAAESLRISARSVTGTLRSLMDRLGVENRFQLGLALGTLRVGAPPSLMSRSDPTHGEF